MLTSSTAVSEITDSQEIGEREFRLFREIIQSETGIQIKDARKALVAGRLGKRLRTLGLNSFREYYEYLQGPANETELVELVNCITTNKTSFFREDEHFRVLHKWLPEMAARRSPRPVRIWCAASSTGEEPYSIVMTALDALGKSGNIEVLASDIDTNVLRTAGAGIYPIASLESVPRQFVRRCFLRGVGEWDGFVRVKPEIRNAVDFRQFNLIRPPWTITGRFDAIFIRNVVIYFDQPTQRGLFGRLSAHLEPDGLLFVGSSESLFWLPELYKPVCHAVYRTAVSPVGNV